MTGLSGAGSRVLAEGRPPSPPIARSKENTMHRRLTATLAAIALALGGAVAVATPASAG